MVWVNCGEKDCKPHGFCLYEPLFTYTERNHCNDYVEGKPTTEEEWEKAQEQWVSKK